MVHLNEHFTYKKIIKAVIMPIFMMVFTSVYSIVDGFFVSNYVNKTAFAALNLVFPTLMILGSIGFMMGAGGSALVAKSLGEGKKDEANKIFSGVVYATAIMGIVVTLLVVFFVKDISVLLGATEEMLPYCVTYARILVAGITLFMIQNLFQTFFIVAERPHKLEVKETNCIPQRKFLRKWLFSKSSGYSFLFSASRLKSDLQSALQG